MATTSITTKEIGTWGNGGRFLIRPKFHTESSRAVRSPSRAWPYSEWKHIKTKKYAKQLAELLGVDEVQII